MQPFKLRESVQLSDLDGRFPDHTWVFWASPTPAVFAALFGPAQYSERAREGKPMTDAEYASTEDAYYHAIAECVLDTGESGLDLSSATAVRAAFFASDMDAELLGGIVMAYTERLITKREERQKKVAALFHSTDGSSSNGARESTSPTTSSRGSRRNSRPRSAR